MQKVTSVTKVFWLAECSPRNNRLDFGGDLEHDHDPQLLDVDFMIQIQQFLKGFFIYY